MQYSLDIFGELFHDKNKAISRAEKKGIVTRMKFFLTHSLQRDGSVSKSLDGITLISIVKVIVQLNLIDGLIQLGRATERIAPDWRHRRNNNAHLSEKR
jgi:hypothetical protein